MSDLRMNKIFGALLATGLVILGLRQVSDMVYSPAEVAKPGYAIAVQADQTAAAPEAADTPPDWGTVLPTADVAAGQVVSTKCGSCHTFTAGGPAMTGPNQYNLVGRKPGSAPGFAYSAAMTDFGSKHPAWDYDQLYLFLANPQAYVQGTKMNFIGLKKPEDRINLIAWLRQQSSAPVPIPAPNPAAAAKAPTTGAADPQAPAAASATPAPAAK